jgi:hypothetical protein
VFAAALVFAVAALVAMVMMEERPLRGPATEVAAAPPPSPLAAVAPVLPGAAAEPAE